jgi:virginiamycin B lyase
MSSSDRNLSAAKSVLCTLTLLAAPFAVAQDATPATPPAQTPATGQAPRVRPPRIPRPGVKTEGVSRPMSDLVTEAVVPVEGSPDWATISKDAIWITSARANHVVQIVAATNKPGFIIDVQRPCSGLAYGADSIWIPSCGSHSVLRVDAATGKTLAEVPADPSNSEGGITFGAGSAWIVTKPATLVRIDPKTNTVASSLELPSGSQNPLFTDGFVWVTSIEHDSLLKIDPKTNTVVDTIPVGPKPRFITTGGGSIWTLNQGDGTVSRVDIKSGKLVATIACGIPGTGGEITFGAGSIWPTNIDFPVSQIDVATNKVVKQWGGPGGDGIKFGFGSVWLSNGREQTVARFSPAQK